MPASSLPSDHSQGSGREPDIEDDEISERLFNESRLSHTPSLTGNNFQPHEAPADNDVYDLDQLLAGPAGASAGIKAVSKDQEPPASNYSHRITQESVIDEAEQANNTSYKVGSDVDVYTGPATSHPFPCPPPIPGTPLGPPALIPGSVQFQESFLGRQDIRASGECTLRLDDTIASFVKAELDPDDSIKDLVVLTGPPHCLWATTCQDYVRRIWPETADQILEFFECLSRPVESTQEMDIATSGKRLSVSCQELVWNSNKKELDIKVATDPQALSCTVEALAWLHATVQCSPEGVAASGVYLEDKVDLSGYFFRFTPYALMPLSVHGADASSSCWMPLVPHAATAVGFTTPARPIGPRGMEVTFELMCYLCGLEYEMVEDGCLVLYGRKSMVYPVRQIYDCVEWHFVSLEDGSIDNFRRDGISLRIDDIEVLRWGKRHFIGLWADPRVTLGSETGGSSELSWSPAPEVRQEFTRDGRSFGGQIMIPKALNLTWTETFKVARSRKTSYMTNFEAKLHAAINTPVMLYSVVEKRAWIVSFVSVLLHLARARAHCQRELGFRVPACEMSANGGQAAYETIMRFYREPVKHAAPDEILDDLERDLTVKDYINDVWAALDCATRETKKTKGLFRTLIIGYEMADIAHLKSTLRMKKHNLDAFATGWAPLLDEVKLALFCKDLYDPIVAGPDQEPSSPCSQSIWSNIPVGHNILTASLPCLKDMCEHLNDRKCGPRLTSEYLWHNPGQSRSIFATCKRKSKHVCNRLQELRADDGKRAAVSCPSASNLAENPNGVVIFRYKDNMETIQAAVGSKRSARSPSPKTTQDSQTSLSSTLVNPRCTSDSDSGYSDSDYPSPGRAGVDTDEIPPENLAPAQEPLEETTGARLDTDEIAPESLAPAQEPLEETSGAISLTPPPLEHGLQIAIPPKGGVQVHGTRRARAKSGQGGKRTPVSRRGTSFSTKNGNRGQKSRHNSTDTAVCVLM